MAAATEGSQLARGRALPVQMYAKIAGVLMLLSFIGGGFGEAYVPSKLIVATDAAATVQHLSSSELIFRLGFAGYLVICAANCVSVAIAFASLWIHLPKL